MLGSNANKVIAQIKKYRDSLTVKCKTFTEELVRLGVDAAEVRFSTAPRTDNEPIDVSSHWVGDKLLLTASGSTILFAEFGTGLYPKREPFVDYPKDTHIKIPMNVVPRGTYGLGWGSSKDGWRFEYESDLINPPPDTHRTIHYYEYMYKKDHPNGTKVFPGVHVKRGDLATELGGDPHFRKYTSSRYYHTRGQQPAAAMHEADELMREKILSVAREVFHD